MNQLVQQALSNFITPSRIEKLKLLLGDESQQIENSFEKAFPAVLDGIKAKAATPGGAGYIIDTAKNAYDNNISDSIDTIFSGGGEWTHTGGNILNSIFPDNEHGVIQKISDNTGAKKSSTHNILIIASLLIFSLIGKEFAGRNANGGALLGFLSGAPAAALAEEPKKKSGWLMPLLLLLLLGLLA